MPPVEWTEALQLDHEPMDRVHREFIALLATAERASDAELASAWAALIDHTATHFAMEDGWMRETRFAAAADHQLQHRVVLKFGGYQVLFPLTGAVSGGGDDGLIVGLAAAGGEHDLARVGSADQLRDLGTAGEQMLGRLLPEGVERAGIAVDLVKIRKHGFLSGGG